MEYQSRRQNLRIDGMMEEDKEDWTNVKLR